MSFVELCSITARFILNGRRGSGNTWNATFRTVPYYKHVYFRHLVFINSMKKDSEQHVQMIRKKAGLGGIVTGLSLVLLGALIALCSMPIFSYTQEETQLVQKSETIIDSSFNIHQSQDKLVQAQLSIGQKLHILATGSGNFNFSIVHLTNTSQVIQPDVIYLSLNNTHSVNKTWTPQVRSAQPKDYHLVFFARDAPTDSSVHIYANVTKTWTEPQSKLVVAVDRRSIIDRQFVYIGLGVTILGAAVSLVAVHSKNMPRNRR